VSVHGLGGRGASCRPGTDCRAAAEALDSLQAEGGTLPQLFCVPFVAADVFETSTGVTSAGLDFLDE
jgi:Asp-tRNA(Asn)/Glu-tRNA(Gln) amidotransferase A subunit family amidase